MDRLLAVYGDDDDDDDDDDEEEEEGGGDDDDDDDDHAKTKSMSMLKMSVSLLTYMLT